MHPKLLDEIVALCRRRQEQGDYPTEPMTDPEVMENAIVQLADKSDELNIALLKARARRVIELDAGAARLLAMRQRCATKQLQRPPA